MPVRGLLCSSSPAKEPHEVDAADLAALAVLQERYPRDVYRYVLRRVPRPESGYWQDRREGQAQTCRIEGKPCGMTQP